ncbi:MAG: hypothetical protein ACRD1K_03940 [Acidimicrobiales bacterium]
MADGERSRVARAASERALVRVVHHYGACPEFVVLGGLVPELLCAGSGWRHAGTTDVDVQVDLEVACGAVNTARLENALRNAEFEPDTERVWRWVADGTSVKTVVKFELLADLESEPNGATVRFDACDNLGAVNLRGTGFASRDPVVQQLTAKIGGDLRTVEVNVNGLAGFLLAKSTAARSRRLAKDWYDVAFVLLHNDLGGVESAADAVRARFEPDLVGAVRSRLRPADADRPPGARRCRGRRRRCARRRGLPQPTVRSCLSRGGRGPDPSPA